MNDLPVIASLSDLPPELQPALDEALGTIDAKTWVGISTELIVGLASFLFERDAEPLKTLGEEFPEFEILDDALDS